MFLILKTQTKDFIQTTANDLTKYLIIAMFKMEFYKPYSESFSDEKVTDPQNQFTTPSALHSLSFSVMRPPIISKCNTGLWRLHSSKGFYVPINLAP